MAARFRRHRGRHFCPRGLAASEPAQPDGGRLPDPGAAISRKGGNAPGAGGRAGRAESGLSVRSARAAAGAGGDPAAGADPSRRAGLAGGALGRHRPAAPGGGAGQRLDRAAAEAGPCGDRLRVFHRWRNAARGDRALRETLAGAAVFARSRGRRTEPRGMDGARQIRRRTTRRMASRRSRRRGKTDRGRGGGIAVSDARRVQPGRWTICSPWRAPNKSILARSRSRRWSISWPRRCGRRRRKCRWARRATGW